MRLLIAILLVHLVAMQAVAQDMSAEEVVASIADRLATVKAYTARAIIELDVDFIEMPPKEATLHYHAPDSFRVDGEGFLMIPKIGLKPVAKQLDLARYRAIEKGFESINGVDHMVIDMLPVKRNGRVVLSTLWVDRANKRISRIETFTKRHGSYMVDMTYNANILPSRIVVTFEVEGLNIPVQYFGNSDDVPAGFDPGAISEGKVVVELSEYSIEYR